MRQLYSIKFKKAHAYKQRKNKEKLEILNQRNFQELFKKLLIWTVMLKDVKHNMKEI